MLWNMGRFIGEIASNVIPDVGMELIPASPTPGNVGQTVGAGLCSNTAPAPDHK
jgi:hypothetical protein